MDVAFFELMRSLMFHRQRQATKNACVYARARPRNPRSRIGLRFMQLPANEEKKTQRYG